MTTEGEWEQGREGLKQWFVEALACVEAMNLRKSGEGDAEERISRQMRQFILNIQIRRERGNALTETK